MNLATETKNLEFSDPIYFRTLYLLELAKRELVEETVELKESVRHYGLDFVLEIVESYFFGYREWLSIIPILNHPDSKDVVELYRLVSFFVFYMVLKRVKI